MDRELQINYDDALYLNESVQQGVASASSIAVFLLVICVMIFLLVPYGEGYKLWLAISMGVVIAISGILTVFFLTDATKPLFKIIRPEL